MIDRNYKQTVAPSGQVVTTTEMKLHLRVDHNDDDLLIDFLLSAAVEAVETRIRRKLLTQTWELALDQFPSALGVSAAAYPTLPPWLAARYESLGAIRIEMTPVSAVSSIYYTNTDGNSTLLATTEYTADLRPMHPRIVPAYNKSWPATRPVPNAVIITFVCGFGAAAAVPNGIKQAIRFLVATWYQNRESLISDGESLPVPLGFSALINQYKVRTF